MASKQDSSHPSQAKASARRTPAIIDALVVRALADAKRPMSAYDIARDVSKTGGKLTANQVYRVLRRLGDGGKILRIETLNAYILSDQACDGVLVCHACRHAFPCKLNLLKPSLAKMAAKFDFTATRPVIELSGLCSDCRERQPD